MPEREDLGEIDGRGDDEREAARVKLVKMLKVE